VSVRIRLKRFGTKKRPFYRIVVMDSRTPRDGRVLEEIGLYHPIEKLEKQLSVDTSKVKDWLARGATPSNTVKQLLNRKAASTYSADSASTYSADSASRPADSAGA
jgi:small subunit ribosomal protein S16